MTRLVGPWNFCTGLPDRHGGSNPTYDTRACQHHSVLHLQELVNYGLGAANFLPECTHDMVWYTMVKTTKKKNRNVVFVFARNCHLQKYQNTSGLYEKMPCTPPCEKNQTLSLSLQEIVHRAGSINTDLRVHTRKCRAHRLAKKLKKQT